MVHLQARLIILLLREVFDVLGDWGGHAKIYTGLRGGVMQYFSETPPYHKK